MAIDQINKDDYPEKQQDGVKALQKLLEEFQGFQEILGAEMRKIQENCSHKFKPVKLRNPNFFKMVYGLGSLPEIFTGEKCTKCKIFIPRKSGPPWRVCHNCGGNMEEIPSPNGFKFRTFACSCDHKIIMFGIKI